MRQEFRESLKDTVAGCQVAEPEPLEGDSMEPISVSPTWVIKMHCRHLADYVKLFIEEGEGLTMGEAQDPLGYRGIFSFHFSLIIYFLDHLDFLSSISLNPSSHFQALQKIHLAPHIRHMADLLHADATQQLEVAFLERPAAQVIDFLAGGITP